MKRNIEQFSCLTCNRPFFRNISARPRGYSGNKIHKTGAKTCSKSCSKVYIVYSRKHRSKIYKNKPI